jgi:hypothetical protein
MQVRESTSPDPNAGNPFAGANPLSSRPAKGRS